MLDIKSSIVISQAEKKDIKDILKILEPYIEAGKLLPRDENDILSSLHNFFVARHEKEYIGCTAVRDYDNGLFEVRSLAVLENFSGKGIGFALIKFAVDFVKKHRNAKKVFALTRRPNVFIRLGFEIVPMEMFPKKIWFDCSKCKKLDCCDEVAVLHNIE